MTKPTNTDIAAALREIADTLPLGSALIVRLAAGRLGDGDGWIEWGGGKSPVKDNVKVVRKYRDGIIGYAKSNNEMEDYWEHTGRSHDIIAYRIVK